MYTVTMKIVNFDDVLKEELKDPEFKKLFEAERLKTKRAVERKAKKKLSD